MVTSILTDFESSAVPIRRRPLVKSHWAEPLRHAGGFVSSLLYMFDSEALSCLVQSQAEEYPLSPAPSPIPPAAPIRGLPATKLPR